jgi:AraC-like DNA-binding protein
MSVATIRAQQTVVTAWRTEEGLFECYRYPAGPAGRGALHVHPDVHLCLSLDFPGRYRRGGRVDEVPAGAVSVVEPWTAHALEDPCDRPIASHYRVMYLAEEQWRRRAADAGRSGRIERSVTVDRRLARAFARLHVASERGDSMLAQDEHFVHVMRQLAPCSTQSDDREPILAPAASRLERAREYLHAHAADTVSLREVAAIAALAPWHFATSFRLRFGVPPHRFQVLMRIERAKRCLAAGAPISEVAIACGFADQSHLTRHFTRIVGVTPGAYLRGRLTVQPVTRNAATLR